MRFSSSSRSSRIPYSILRRTTPATPRAPGKSCQALGPPRIDQQRRGTGRATGDKGTWARRERTDLYAINSWQLGLRSTPCPAPPAPEPRKHPPPQHPRPPPPPISLLGAGVAEQTSGAPQCTSSEVYTSAARATQFAPPLLLCIQSLALNPSIPEHQLGHWRHHRRSERVNTPRLASLTPRFRVTERPAPRPNLDSRCVVQLRQRRHGP